MSAPDFFPMFKIPRLRRDCVITEKLDGTNAVIYVSADGEVLAGSKNRFLTVEADNHGFAQWVYEHRDVLKALGPGWHRGEWWGFKINRGYGLTEKRFSLFNVERWTEETPPPAPCNVVPVLYRGPFDSLTIEYVLGNLEEEGSVAAPGYGRPEGIVVRHSASGHLYKVTVEADEMPKGLQKSA